MAKIDLLADTGSTGDLTNCRALAQQMIELEKLIEVGEKSLEILNDKLKQVRDVELPSMMEAIGVADFTLTDHSKVTIKDIIRASLPSKTAIEKAPAEEAGLLEARLNEGLSWLRTHKAGDLIKNTLTIGVGKGNDKAADQISKLAAKFKLPVKRDESVNPNTLSSYVKEQLEKGTDIPFETFGVFTGKQAKITPPKERK